MYSFDIYNFYIKFLLLNFLNMIFFKTFYINESNQEFENK